MGKIYKSDDRRLPNELRRSFEAIVGQKHFRPLLFETKATKAFAADEPMEVEGCANLAEADRWDEVITPQAWVKRLGTFKKNGIILVEHDRTKAVGLPTDVWVKENGLFYKATIGDPRIAELTLCQRETRSLLAQGILKANSVGFIPHVIEWDEDAEVLRYTDVELLEISIVAIPMQQDSLITSVKSWRNRMSGAATTKSDDQPTAGMIEENTRLTKSCHEMLVKMCEKSDADAKALKAELEAAKAALAAKTKAFDDLEAKAKKLLASLTEKGLIKAPAKAA